MLATQLKPSDTFLMFFLFLYFMTTYPTYLCDADIDIFICIYVHFCVAFSPCTFHFDFHHGLVQNLTCVTNILIHLKLFRTQYLECVYVAVCICCILSSLIASIVSPACISFCFIFFILYSLFLFFSSFFSLAVALQCIQ